MAVSASSSLTQFLPPIHVSPKSRLGSSSSYSQRLNKHHSPEMATHKRRSISLVSSKLKSDSENVGKRQLLEHYGLNPDEFLSEPSMKSKRKNEKVAIIRKEVVEVADEPKPPRSTHKLLQVLGGTAKRKKLLSPKGMDVRPMMEVVKGAAFDILQAAGGCPTSLRPGRWLDLYSGTGSVGIEAMSRGCSEVHFVEMDPWVITNVLQPNLQWTGFLDSSVIHAVRVENFFSRSEQLVGKSGPFDYVSVTPPYMAVDYCILMEQISKSAMVGEDTFVVVEYPLRTDMLDSCGCLPKIADRRFGRTHLAIYGPTWAKKRRT